MIDFDEWHYDALLDMWIMPRTYTSILGEDMPWELVP